MRLISQDGTIDCPYETSSVHVDRYGDSYEIWVDCSRVLATYSTKEKALKVMEDIRDNWLEDFAFYKFPADEDVKESDNQC